MIEFDPAPALRRGRRRGVAGRAVSAAMLLFCFSCTSPAPAPIDSAETARTIVSRAAEIEKMGESAAAPAFWRRPDAALARDPGHLDYWRTAAFAFSPAVRAARRKVLVAQKDAEAAGLPGPIALTVDHMGIDDADRSTEVAATFDVLGAFGAGRAAAARRVADENLRAAYAELEDAIWTADAALERAFFTLAVRRETRGAVARLIDDRAAGEKRLDALCERGRIADLDLARFRTIKAAAEGMKSETDAAVADAVRELAMIVGLAAEDPAFAAVGLFAETAAIGGPAERPSTEDLARRSLSCRQKLQEYAVAEADVRMAAAEEWPDVRFGPKPVFEPGRVIPGGMLEIEIPFPGSAEKKVARALAARDGARERYEDTILAVLNESTARRALAAAAAAGRKSAEEAFSAASVEWRGAAARFAVDAAMLEAWTMAFERRIEAAVALGRAREEDVRRRIDVREIEGPTNEPEAEPLP